MIGRTTIPRKASGFVLIMALFALALMTILLLALLQGTSHQARGSLGDALSTREKMLADSAVALVIGQIQQASTQTGQTWISQPGLLRTYDATSSRKPTACYKLYSAAQMIDTSGTLAFLGTDVPADWNSSSNQSLYTDLNAPQQTPGFFGKTVYPILNPNAAAITGMSIDSGHEVEMPVQWLYQLQDGTLGPASRGTKENPIVARLAFWTDDDTCKININTAGYGSPWNTPRVNSTDDVAWSTTQPANGEFSRYPGHPAMTALDVVFPAKDNSHWPQQLLGLTPRYGFGGSEFGTQATAPNETVPAKTNRLYASLDELCFDTGFTGSGQRQANPVTPDQIDNARFVLTAHSQAPETTLLGEPRIAIWPVSDMPQDPTRTTPTDRAIESTATIGTRNYFFQRHDPLDDKDDFDPASISPASISNLQLFNELVARGNRTLPGYDATKSFTQKYPGANWTQLMLEITDFIHGLNSVDPSPAPFVPFACDNNGVGRGFIDPLTTTYGSGASQTTLRGLGRCPTLSSLTLVFYVCGFGFDDNTEIDYDKFPADQLDKDHLTASWEANFDPTSPTNRWAHVTYELVRAFVVPCTFHPGCAYPEVNDACDIQISGLDAIQVTSGTNTDNFGFAASATSPLLGTPLQVLSPERAWGGNEGPITWRATGDALAAGNAVSYPFAGAKAFKVPFNGSTALRDPHTNPRWPPTQTFTFNGVPLTVVIRDSKHVPQQTLHINLRGFSTHAPTINGECDHMDGDTPANAHSDWATNPAMQVKPSYYMNLRNRLLATQNSRSVFIQNGDISRSMEAATDLRVIAALSSVPETLFTAHPNYTVNATDGSHAHNLRFADGTSACFASGTVKLVPWASYPNNTIYPIPTTVDWRNSSLVPYSWSISPPCSAPTGTTYTNMGSLQNGSGLPSPNGDWDTGPGFSPDGAQINLPDSGTALAPSTAYFSLANSQRGAATQRTPNALVPSPVIFGSLPAGLNPVLPEQSQPWRTLLFCPNPAANFCATPPTTVTATMHPGFATPPDHLLLDNFWMPVVEPYAISTCMATAGKINLNDQIAPFTYLHRNTALHALLHNLRIPAISALMAGTYKSSGTSAPSIWKTVDENSTLSLLENRFADTSTDAYLSESEICTVPIVPQGVAPNPTSLGAFWNGSASAEWLTGDNLRELPYAQLYSRLTTRSNSYTVHIRVQVLQKLTRDPHQDVWNEGTDRVLGDWRGSYEIQRYLDPAAQAPPAAPAPVQPLGPYRYRIVSSNRFSP